MLRLLGSLFSDAFGDSAGPRVGDNNYCAAYAYTDRLAPELDDDADDFRSKPHARLEKLALVPTGVGS